MIKRVVLLLALMMGMVVWLAAQNNDTIPPVKDTAHVLHDTTAALKDTTQTIIKDSLQVAHPTDTIDHYQQALKELLGNNIFFKKNSTPVNMIVKPRGASSTDVYFYLVAALVLFMALIRVFFAKYFTNLFRVFFNTSLRQSQLADQLLQAKLPSLFFNLFFIISGGFYIYFILLQYQLITMQNKWILLGACIALLALIYLGKFSTLKFTGWVTGYAEATDTYIFVIFLISKIMGIMLLPFTIFIAFSDKPIAATCALISLLMVCFLLLMRFFRSYGLIQNQLKISRFHFFLYIAGVEIIPLLLIYKTLLILLSKNL
ncbi:DUF4271 domain-containing protein [Ferruginibacter sp.]